jgi:microcystin-dependent protein
MASRNRDFFELTARARPMVGDTKTSALDLDHLGWLKCDGRSLATNQFQFLFDVIGYSFGGSGSNFYLPDPRGCVPGFVGSNDGGYTGPTGPTNRLLGQVVGEEAHTLSIPEMPTHGHTGTTSNATTSITHNAPATDGNYGLIRVSASTGATTNNGTDLDVTAGEPDVVTRPAALALTDPGHVHNFTTTNTGGSNYHNNMQPTIFVGSLFIYSGKPHYGASPFNYTSIPIV